MQGPIPVRLRRRRGPSSAPAILSTFWVRTGPEWRGRLPNQEASSFFRRISAEPVSVVEGPNNQVVSAGSSARFTCVARGNPAPNITWLFNADSILPSSRRFQISASSLVVTHVAPEDEGMFQCLVDNGVGTATSYGMLTVLSGM